EVVKKRTLAEHERAVLRPIDLGAGEVSRQQIRRELQAMEVALDVMTQHLDRARFRQARRALDEQMPVAQERDQHAVQQTLLADDEALQVRLETDEFLLQRRHRTVRNQRR